MTTEAELAAAKLKQSRDAISSFESATGMKARNATEQDLAAWGKHMRHHGISIPACRRYEELVRAAADPKRAPAKRTLSVDEIKFMLHVAAKEDHTWLAVSLLAGTECLAWTWSTLYNPNLIVPMEAYLLIVEEAIRRGYKTFDHPYRGKENAKWVDVHERDARIWQMPQAEINRRLKDLAKRAGIGMKNMDIATLHCTRQQLANKHGSAEKTAKVLGIRIHLDPSPPKSKVPPHKFLFNQPSQTYIESAL